MKSILQKIDNLNNVQKILFLLLILVMFSGYVWFEGVLGVTDEENVLMVVVTSIVLLMGIYIYRTKN